MVWWADGRIGGHAQWPGGQVQGFDGQVSRHFWLAVSRVLLSCRFCLDAATKMTVNYLSNYSVAAQPTRKLPNCSAAAN